MCWAWAAPSSSAGTLTTAGEEERGETTVTAICLYRQPNGRHLGQNGEENVSDPELVTKRNLL